MMIVDGEKDERIQDEIRYTEKDDGGWQLGSGTWKLGCDDWMELVQIMPPAAWRIDRQERQPVSSLGTFIGNSSLNNVFFHEISDEADLVRV
jgi:hypothetical protein